MPTKLASLAMAAIIGLLLGCGPGTSPIVVSVSPCATGSWHAASGALSLTLSLQASEDCELRPPSSASVQGSGIVTQGAVSTPVNVTGSQQWFDLALALRSADSSLVASYVAQFDTRDSVLGVLTCSRGCTIGVDSSFVLRKQ